MKIRFSILKRNAKDALRGNWGNAIGILVVYTIIGNSIGAIPMLFYPFQDVAQLLQTSAPTIADFSEIYPKMGTTWLVSVLLSIFLLAPLSCGFAKVWLDRSRGQHTTITTLFWIFSRRYTPFLKTYVWMLLFVFLWMLAYVCTVFVCAMLTAISGILAFICSIVASIVFLLVILRYEMTLFVFIDNPDMGCRAILNESKRLMAGNLCRYILLSLSFIGWALLCILIIPALWILPYIGVTMANFYRSLIGDLPQQQQPEPIKPELEY